MIDNDLGTKKQLIRLENMSENRRGQANIKQIASAMAKVIQSNFDDLEDVRTKIQEVREGDFQPVGGEAQDKVDL